MPFFNKPGDILDEPETPGEEEGDGCGIPRACHGGQAQKDLGLERRKCRRFISGKLTVESPLRPLNMQRDFHLGFPTPLCLDHRRRKRPVRILFVSVT